MAWWNPATWGRKSLSTLELIRSIYGGGAESKSGQTITWQTALQVTTALACARVVANGLAQVPFRPYRPGPDRGPGLPRGREPARDHWAWELIGLRPNPWMTSFELRQMMGFHLMLCGNFYAYKNRVGAGARARVVELLPFVPGTVQEKQNPDMSITYKVIFPATGKAAEISQGDMWHIRGPSWDGLCGMQFIRMAREALGLALATEEHASRMFANGALISGVLESDARQTPDGAKALREQWDAQYAGTSNNFRTAILWGGLKWKPIAMQSDHAQLALLRDQQVEEVCRAAGVLPIMVGHSDKTATYASAEQMFLAHVVHTMSPLYQMIEQSADVNLLTDEDRKAGIYTHFAPNALMRGAAKDRAEFYTKIYGVGGLSPNEIREFEDLNPYEGGDERRVPLNMVDPNAPAPPEKEVDPA